MLVNSPYSVRPLPRSMAKSAAPAVPAEEAPRLRTRSLWTAGAVAVGVLLPAVSGLTSASPAPVASQSAHKRSHQSLQREEPAFTEDEIFQFQDPVTDAQEKGMDALAKPRTTDSAEAAEVRQRYNDLRQNAELTSVSFAADASAVTEEGGVLQIFYEEKPAGQYQDVMGQVTVEKAAGQVHVTLDEGKATVDYLHDGPTTVSAKQSTRADGTVVRRTYEESPRWQRLTDEVNGQISRLQTRYMQDNADGHRKGDFVVTRHLDSGDEEMEVRGLSISTESHKTVSGIAGDIQQVLTERAEIPEMQAQGSPRTEMTYTRTQRTSSAFGDQATTRQVQLLEDGTTRP